MFEVFSEIVFSFAGLSLQFCIANSKVNYVQGKVKKRQKNKIKREGYISLLFIVLFCFIFIQC